jgi:hypothetical protein
MTNYINRSLDPELFIRHGVTPNIWPTESTRQDQHYLITNTQIKPQTIEMYPLTDVNVREQEVF